MSVRLEQLLAAATPGPWRRYFLRERVVIDHAKFRVAEIHADPEGPRVYQDAALIALAPDMARLLIDMGEALRGLDEWDHMQTAADGRYWREDVIAPLRARLDALGKDTA